MRIQVQPEQLRHNAQVLRQGSEFWQAQAARLRQAFGSLDWETRHRLEVESQVQQAISLAEGLAARAGEKASFLEAAAARFEQADQDAPAHVLDPAARPEAYDPKIGCVDYATKRRPDLLVRDAAIPGAADYIPYYEKKGQVIHVSATETDLRRVVRPGYAVVWDHGHPELQGTPGSNFGHVAIVEEVYPDRVVISQAGWGTQYRRELTREQLATLALIL